MNMFEEISAQKEDFPKIKSINKEISKVSLNAYQKLAVGLFALVFILGIILGNLFATCETTSYFYSEACHVTEFNFSLMLGVWLGGFLLSLMIYSVGHIISLLDQINEKLSKK